MKTKFDPKDVPRGCKWIAVDESGRCWAYNSTKQPSRHRIGVWVNDSYAAASFLYQGKPPKNWKDELYTWK